MTTTKIINSQNINEVDFIQNRKGVYQAIVKVQAGFMSTVNDLGISANWKSGPQWNRAIDVFRNFQKGALQTIEFKPEGTDAWLTVFARSGKKIILMDKQMFEDFTVGDINHWASTDLYSQTNYQLCNAKTWADKAFVLNEPELESFQPKAFNLFPMPTNEEFERYFGGRPKITQDNETTNV